MKPKTTGILVIIFLILGLYVYFFEADLSNQKEAPPPDFEKALDFLREGFVHHPADGRIKIKMAVCHLKLKNRNLAKKFLKEALKADGALIDEFEYYVPKNVRSDDIERIIQQYK